MADFTSPLDKVAIAGVFGRSTDEPLVLSHRICTGLAQVTTWPESYKKAASAVKRVTGLKWQQGHASPGNDKYALLSTGPGRALLEAFQPGLVEKLRKFIPPEFGAITDLCHGRVVVRISGKKAEWVLSKGIAVDFSTAAFPVETAIITSHHDTGLVVRRVDDQCFDIFVFTSLARDFWHWLEKAAAECGYEVRA